MSWVEEQKATTNKNINEVSKKLGVFKVIAAPAKETPIKPCIKYVHHRFVLKISIKGLHAGLKTQGADSKLV